MLTPTVSSLIEYEATLSGTPECELSVIESVDVNIGAFAHCVGEINYSTMGVSPAVVTTVLDVPLPRYADFFWIASQNYDNQN